MNFELRKLNAIFMNVPLFSSHCSEFSYNLSAYKENNLSNVSATTVAFIRGEYKLVT